MPNTCGPVTQNSIPNGGMGQSARCSRVFFVPPNCSNGVSLNGVAPTGVAYWLSEQVTRISIRSMVSNRKYGHDKSYCWQDVTKGIASCNGSIQTKAQCCSPPISFQSGMMMWLQIYPFGVTNGGVGSPTPVIQGYAEIEEDPFEMNLENGDPVEHNYTFASKGCWTLPTTMAGVLTAATFDCCACCQNCTGGYQAHDPMEGSVFAEDFSAKLDNAPVTVYRWTAKDEWVVALDECSGAYMPGPIPQDKPKDDTDTLRIVHGILAV